MENEEYKLFDPCFSTADAEAPSFSYLNNQLVLNFINWQEKKVKVIFYNVVGVKWEENLEHLPSEVRDDSVYVVLKSEWARSYITENQTYKHYKLCFNAAGFLDVLCTGFDVE